MKKQHRIENPRELKLRQYEEAVRDLLDIVARNIAREHLGKDSIVQVNLELIDKVNK